jgi:hypothetical protein
MPYTPAHPITAIVINKLFPNKFNKTGLVLGSIAPDLLNFVMLRPADTTFGHSHIGMLTVGLPASIALAFVFHRLVLPAAAVHLPAPINRIAYHYAEQGWRIAGVKAWVVLVLSIMLGMYSHLFLDGFSHRGGIMYPIATSTVERLFPWVDSPAMLLQFGLSVLVIGIELLLLAVFLLRRLRIPSNVPRVPGRTKWTYWSVVLLATIAITAFALFIHPSSHYRHLLFIIPVAPLTGAVVGLLAASVVHAGRHRSSGSFSGNMK